MVELVHRTSEQVERQLPGWSAITDDGEFVTERHFRDVSAIPHRKVAVLPPRHLLTINWADSGPGYSWPVAYYVATDWHELEKERFVAHVAGALERLVRAEKVKKIVIVAPPRTLAELRHAFHADVKNRIVAELDKDLTNRPVWEIEKHLIS
jgi:hypothetical protein